MKLILRIEILSITWHWILCAPSSTFSKLDQRIKRKFDYLISVTKVKCFVSFFSSSYCIVYYMYHSFIFNLTKLDAVFILFFLFVFVFIVICFIYTVSHCWYFCFIYILGCFWNCVQCFALFHEHFTYFVCSMYVSSLVITWIYLSFNIEQTHSTRFMR